MQNLYGPVRAQYPDGNSEDSSRRKRNETCIQALVDNSQVNPDPYLPPPGLSFVDHDNRHAITLLSRPPHDVISVINTVQYRLGSVAQVWFPGNDLLHLTLMEIIHSQPEAELARYVDNHDLKGVLKSVDNLLQERQFKLHAPSVSIDANGIALSFVTAPDSGVPSSGHLRYDLFNVLTSAGITPAPRYAGPSCHVSLGRYSQVLTQSEIQALIGEVSKLNGWLADEKVCWTIDKAQFTIGKTWYGGGDRID
uniref:ARAD1A05280p n=1 Tax=Blastobotrys adeninivorans TaxID=409370 RepID=A0A060SX19_BLAAD